MGKVFEELEDLGFGVGVVKPDGADVAWVGGVVGDFGCVEVVPTDGGVEVSFWIGTGDEEGGDELFFGS